MAKLRKIKQVEKHRSYSGINEANTKDPGTEIK
jgi:hypothetical protein